MGKRFCGFTLSIVLIFTLFISSTSLATTDTTKEEEIFVAKPLVILMDYKDYSHKDLMEKEEWTINGFEGDHFTKEFYEKMFFGEDTYKGSDGRDFITMNKFFKESSGNTYSVKGGVAGWYTAKNNAKYYGANTDGSDQDDATRLVMEAVEKVAADPNIDLSDYDVEDKWDKDKDGNYYEPDGIIDTLIVVHAGRGEEWDNGLGEDAIWPFRAGLSWYDTTDYKMYEVTDHKGEKWLAEDFTVFEQDLPLDLLIHEYGHVLGLPDLYSTSGGNPPVENWSLMGGSYTGVIPGTFPNDFGAYCKEYLQDKFEKMFKNDKENNFKVDWQNKATYNYEDINSSGIDVTLDQTSLKGNNKDAVRIDLPQKKTIITTPTSGKYAYFSGNDNNSENFMTTDLDLTGKESAKLTFKTWYDIDPGFDFASIMVKEKGKEDWTAIEGNITTTEVDDWVKENETPKEIEKRNPGHGITNDSGNEWVDAEFDLTGYVGKEIDLAVRWYSDGNTPEKGIYIDDIEVIGDGDVILSDNGEKESEFKLEDFSKNDGIVKSEHYYILEWRNNTGKIDKLYTSWSETASYDPGLVVWYIDKMWINDMGRPDQNTEAHTGYAFAGVVDASQEPVLYEYTSGDKKGENGIERVGYQMYDAAFSLRENSGFNKKGDTYKVWDSDITPRSVFDDSRDYTSKKSDPQGGLKLPKYGLKFLVTEESSDRSTAKIHIMRTDRLNKEMDIRDIEVNGSKVTVTVEKGEKELSSKATLSYVLDSEEGLVEKVITLTKDTSGNYTGSIAEINKVNRKGIWKVSHVIIEDKEGNAKAFYNSDVHSGYGINLSSGNIK
ncbi:immune inhibitor A domain-containing protein [Dethiothermospora halolimnae]|uniref:immune inhibitor A domain-containing protein n=1 Tax=Dethiothermospora halolimnae TaxID=3114390 RepID=UPI003CCC1D03